MSVSRVKRNCSLNLSPLASTSFADVYLVTVTAFDGLNRVFANTSILRLDRNASSGGINKGRCVGVHAGVASSPATGERTTVFIGSCLVIQGTPDQRVTQVVITTIICA